VATKARDGVYRAAAPREKKGAPFRLPEDQAGELLGKVLPLRLSSQPLNNPIRAVPRPVPFPTFAEPRLALPAVTPDLPRLPEVVRKAPARPQFVQEEGLEDSFTELTVPREPSFVTGKRTREVSDDASLPPPLPVLAVPVPDRVSLDDATTEVSTAEVLSAELPPRSTPAAFQRMTVPEPFEHHLPLTLSLPDELPDPEAATPQLPQPTKM
jgi:hypothetical protein